MAIPVVLYVALLVEALADCQDRCVPQTSSVFDVQPSHFVNFPHVIDSYPISERGVPFFAELSPFLLNGTFRSLFADFRFGGFAEDFLFLT